MQRWLLEARLAAQSSEIQRLEQELLSNSARVELLVALRDVEAADKSRAETRVAELEALVSRVRQEEAEQARQEAERMQREALGKDPLIQRLTAEVADLARELEPIGPGIDQTRERRAEVEKKLAKLKDDQEVALKFLDIGISDALGVVLLELRRSLPNAARLRSAVAARSGKVADIRLRLFKIDRELRDLANRQQVVDRWLEEDQLDEAGQPRPARSETEQEQLRLELERSLTTRAANLDRLAKAYREHLNEFGNVDSKEQELLRNSAELASVLDERLLWIRNAQPVQLDNLRTLGNDLLWLLSPVAWRRVLTTTWEDAQAAVPVYGLAGICLLALLAGQRRLRTRLKLLAAKVGRHREDSIFLTVQSIGLQVVRILPMPALLACLAWRLRLSNNAGEFGHSVGAGLQAAAVILLALQLLRSLHGPAGVAAVHFGWSESVCRLIRTHLLWFGGFAVAGGCLVAMTQSQPDPLIRHSIGRFSFLILLLAGAAVLVGLLHPARGILSGPGVAARAAWWRRSRTLWLFLALLIPTTLAYLAAAGFYYAALELLFRLNWTLVVLFSTIFLHSFLLRWLVISQRRLALKVARDKREAQARSREQADLDGLETGVMETYEAIDVDDIKEQTQDLVKISMWLLLAVGLWLSWSGVLPALRGLDQVTLWHHMVIEDGVEQPQPVTLTNLGLALVILLITVAAARNMPGFLEIAVLQRLPLDSGSRYAVRSLALYAIAILGIVSSFNAMGVGWGSVQWLVAALTVGLGFGLQEIFANFVSGLIILLERPIRIGDTVTVGSVSGVVSRIRMRATTITDWSRKELIVPNKNFITGELINWSLSDPILRMEFVIGLAYGSDTTLAHRVILQVCKEHPMVLDQPESNVFFTDFGDNSLNFEARVFVSEPTSTGRSRILHDLHMAIDKACRSNNITIAFPQRDLHLVSAPAVIRVARVADPGAGPETGHPDGS